MANKTNIRKKTSKNLSKKPAPNPGVLVTGDVIIDHHIYHGSRRVPDSKDLQGSMVIRIPGGSKLLHWIINKVSKTVTDRLKEADTELAKPQDQSNEEDKKKAEKTKESLVEYPVQFGINPDSLKNLPSNLHSYAV